MSTTLIPLTQFIINPHGHQSHSYPTIAQAATAIVQLGPKPTAVGARTRLRWRALTDSELSELGAHGRVAREIDGESPVVCVTPHVFGANSAAAGAARRSKDA